MTCLCPQALLLRIGREGFCAVRYGTHGLGEGMRGGTSWIKDILPPVLGAERFVIWNGELRRMKVNLSTSCCVFFFFPYGYCRFGDARIVIM